MRKFVSVLIVTVTFVVGFIACNVDNNDLNSGGKAQLNIHLTDAPFPIDLVSKTMVTIDRVDIKKLGNDTVDSSFIVLSEEEMEIDLLELSNGITELIATAELDSGSYDMIRMHVAGSKIILNDESEFDLKVPSGSASGLKIKIDPPIELESGQVADVLLDFDVSKSFIVKGNHSKGKINGFIFKPVVRAVHLGLAGRVEGNVSDTANVKLENALVKVWLPVENEEDSLITSSFSDADGNYKAIGLPETTYYLTAELDGYKSDTIESVVVNAGASTVVDIDLEPEASGEGE